MGSKLSNEPRFVTPDDFQNYTGKSLDELLDKNANISNASNLFLLRVEDCLLSRLDNLSFRTVGYDDLSDFQLESLQKAIIYQAEYMIRNGDIFTDSGYDIERGEVIDFDKLQRVAICPTSVDLLKNCGLYNHVITNRRRYIDLGYGWKK